MTSWTKDTTFQHSWETVVLGALHKYPNPYNGNVAAIDIVKRYYEPHTGALCTSKLITTQWNTRIPGYLYASENSVIHPQRRHMILETVNLSATSIASAHERMEYIEHPDNPNWTLLRHSTTILTLAWFRSSFKSVSLENAAKGCEAIEWVVSNRLPQLTNDLAETLSSAMPTMSTMKAMCESDDPIIPPSTESVDAAAYVSAIKFPQRKSLFKKFFNVTRLLDTVRDEHFSIF